MKNINKIMKEFKSQQGQLNDFGEDLTSITLNENYDLFIEKHAYENNEFFQIELIDSDSTEIIKDTTCNTSSKAVRKEIEQLLKEIA
jgi:predicted metal-dependent hydrolase